MTWMLAGTRPPKGEERPDDSRRSPWSMVRRLLSSRIAQNAISLYGVQFATFAVPLVTLPYVVRVLSSSSYGLVIFTQSASMLIGVLIDYGFEVSMPRRATILRDDRGQLSRLVADVLGARVLLIAATMLAALIAYEVVPKLHDHPVYVLFAWIAAVAQGLSPSWLFLGIERLRLVSFIPLAARLFAAAFTFVLVKNRGDGWIVLMLFAAGGVLGSIGITALTYRHVDFQLPTLAGALDALRSTSSLFVAGTVNSLFDIANVFVLGLLASNSQVAYYGAADRILRTTLQLVGPLPYVLYPRLAYLHGTGQRARARLWTRRAVVAFGALGVFISACVALLAPLVVDLVYGHGFHAAIPVVRVLGIVAIPLCVVGTLNSGWMIPLHMDRSIVRVALVACVIDIGLAVPLVHFLGALGMAVTGVGVVAAVLFMCTTIVFVTERRSGQSGLLWTRRPEPTVPVD